MCTSASQIKAVEDGLCGWADGNCAQGAIEINVVATDGNVS